MNQRWADQTALQLDNDCDVNDNHDVSNDPVTSRNLFVTKQTITAVWNLTLTPNNSKVLDRTKNTGRCPVNSVYLHVLVIFSSRW